MVETVRPSVRLTPEQNAWIRLECKKKGVSFQKYTISLLMAQGMPTASKKEIEGQMTLFDVEQ